MKGMAVLMLLSLIPHPHASHEDRRYEYHQPTPKHSGYGPATDRYQYPSQSRLFKPVQ